jgi:(p)ppGpp synthase/HD superfamily hydrolase
MTESNSDRQIIEVMPLHAITSMYGEQGLRQRFSIESARLGDRACQEMTARALELAGQLHAQDKRQREPYVNHLLRVALRIICHYGITDPEVICTALLHDSVEDHADGLSPDGRLGAFAHLAANFGSRTAELVEAVTNPTYDPASDRDAQYRSHVAQSLAKNPWARVIKISDFTDNGVGIIHTTGPKAARLARKYAPLIPIFTHLVMLPDTPLSPSVKMHITHQINSAKERFDAQF